MHVVSGRLRACYRCSKFSKAWRNLVVHANMAAEKTKQVCCENHRWRETISRRSTSNQAAVQLSIRPSNMRISSNSRLSRPSEHRRLQIAEIFRTENVSKQIFIRSVVGRSFGQTGRHIRTVARDFDSPRSTSFGRRASSSVRTQYLRELYPCLRIEDAIKSDGCVLSMGAGGVGGRRCVERISAFD